jgi:hypothetical protein
VASRVLRIALILSLMLVGGVAQATTIEYTGSSLKGSEGSLAIVSTGSADQYQVTWSLDTTNFAADADHTVLQSLGFKAFTDITSVSVVSGGPSGTLYWYSGISNSTPNCGVSGATPVGFVCFDLNPDVSATSDLTITKSFIVQGKLDDSLAWTFKGKYGTGNGWVISEQAPGAPAVPEPTAAAVFGAGLMTVSAAMRRRGTR